MQTLGYLMLILLPVAIGLALLAFGERMQRKWRNDELRVQMQEELHQLGYTVRDGLLLPPENSAEWDALVAASLRRREKERLMSGVL